MLSRNNGDFVMNGKGFLLDTNAIIQLLKGNKELLGSSAFLVEEHQ